MSKQMSHEHFWKVLLIRFQVWPDPSIAKLSLPGHVPGGSPQRLHGSECAPCTILGMCPYPDLAANEEKTKAQRT